MRKSILTISRNEHLQNSRTLVLEHAGYHVATALNDKEALRHVEAPNTFCLVLLCHSVPEKSRMVLVPRIKELKPGLPILMLYDGYEPTQAQIDGSLHNLAGPGAVLDMVGFLTQHVQE